MTLVEGSLLRGSINEIVERPAVIANMAANQRCDRISLIFSMAGLGLGATLFVGSLAYRPFISISENALQIAEVIASVAMMTLGTLGIMRYGHGSPTIQNLADTLTTIRNLSLGQFCAKQSKSKHNLFTIDQLAHYQVITPQIASSMHSLCTRYAQCTQGSAYATAQEFLQIAVNLAPLEREWDTIKTQLFIVEP